MSKTLKDSDVARVLSQATGRDISSAQIASAGKAINSKGGGGGSPTPTLSQSQIDQGYSTDRRDGRILDRPVLNTTTSERGVTNDYNNQFNELQGKVDKNNSVSYEKFADILNGITGGNYSTRDIANADKGISPKKEEKEPEVPRSDEDIAIENANKESEREMASLTSQLDQVAYMMDSASNAMIQSIKATYAGMITEMRDSNMRLLEGRKQGELRSGRARYVSGVSQGNLTNEELEGTGRIATLNGKMLSLIADVEQARAENKMSVFKQKWEILKDTKKELSDTVAGIHKAVTDRITAQTNKLKEDRAAQTAKDKSAFEKSERVAPALADSLDRFDTNEQKIAFINQYAKASDLEGYEDILLGDIFEASADNTKRQLDIKNIQSQMGSRSRADQRAEDKANEIGTDKEQSIVNKYLADNGSDADIEKAKTDKTFFYWILNQAEE